MYSVRRSTSPLLQSDIILELQQDRRPHSNEILSTICEDSVYGKIWYNLHTVQCWLSLSNVLMEYQLDQLVEVAHKDCCWGTPDSSRSYRIKAPKWPWGVSAEDPPTGQKYSLRSTTPSLQANVFCNENDKGWKQPFQQRLYLYCC